MPDSHHHPSDRPLLAAAGLVLGAIWWGGGTGQLAQGLALGGIAILLLLAPVDQRPAPFFLPLAGAWLLWAASVYLPAGTWTANSWRQLLEPVGLPSGKLRTPQPWITAAGILWLLAGLAWFAWLTSRPLNYATRRSTMQLLAAGIMGVALVSVICFELKLLMPGWLSPRGFGPFPNRNQTGTVLAIGGLLGIGCCLDAIRRRRRSFVVWLAGIAIVALALVANYSRGGVIVFVLGASVWGAMTSWQRRSWRFAAITATAVLLGAALVLLGGGALAERFAGGADSQVAFRTLIWRDTLRLIQSNPWCGIGLGNFRSLFPLYREASLMQQAVWHPESDWLWLAAESGWPSVLFALATIHFGGLAAFPFEKGTERHLRTAAFAAAVGTVVHSLFDVPMHRPGSALLAVMVLALARCEKVTRLPVTAARWASRGLGLVLLIGAVWIGARKDHLREADAFARAGQLDSADAAASAAVDDAPLNWEAYFARGAIRARSRRVLLALEDFRKARALEPNFAGLPFEESRVWVGLAPALAFEAWRETLRRVQAPADTEYYRAMFGLIPNDASARAELLELADTRANLELEWLRHARPDEAAKHLPDIEQHAQHWGPQSRAEFERIAKQLRTGR